MRKHLCRRIGLLAVIFAITALMEYIIYISVDRFMNDVDPEVFKDYAPSFDENLTRPGERYISLDDFLDCLDARLNVDHRTKTEHAFTNVNTTVPYMVLPVTVEQGDIKALMCNLTVQIRHLMYVQNGGVGSMTAFLDRVQEAFAFTARLKLPRMPQNYGYSVALNVGMRDALSMPFEEVPFFLMANNDVRIPGGMLEDGLPQMYARSLAGRARVAELEAEVATEPNEHTPERFRAVPLRSTDGRHVLVTSRLLPDRIRYQSKSERRSAFAEYYGALYVDHNDQTAFWGLTRLAMEVTGYFDENCYPAYFEDTDYLRRLWLLGFKASNIAGYERTPMLHISGGSILAVRSFVPAPEFRDILPFTRGSKYIIRSGFPGRYIDDKYGLNFSSWPDREMREPYPNERLPLDVYVLNAQRNTAIAELQQVAVGYYMTVAFNYQRKPGVSAASMRRKEFELVPKFNVRNFQRLESYRNAHSLLFLPSSTAPTS